MLKKMFVISAAVIALAACKKEVPSVEITFTPISFGVYTQGQTRGADVTNDNLTSIEVLANYIKDNVTTKYFNETIVQDATKWKSKSYWPASGTMDFYASNNTVSDKGVVTVTSIDDDVVVAKATDQTCSSSPSAVDLSFGHIFSKLAVEAKVADAGGLKATITKIKVSAKAPASYDITKASANWELGNEASETEYYSGTQEISSGTLTVVELTKKYVAPQDVTVKIYCQITTNDGETVLADYSTSPKVVQLTMTEGKTHTINLTFNANKIEFSPDVTDFSSAADTAATIK
ncbi:MAG: fimbrillin family protein [Bacteroidales bacterium]|nr:fimbrillin family protein [Bacteroidales bacterium]